MSARERSRPESADPAVAAGVPSRDSSRRSAPVSTGLSSPKRTLVFFIDPIEASSYPVTETGYALLYRAWCRAEADGDAVYVVYPDTHLELRRTKSATDEGTPVVRAYRVEGFDAVPYDHFRRQTELYDSAADVGSKRCHRESAPVELRLDAVDAIVFRQEIDAGQRTRLLRALARIENRVLVYLSPQLALQARYGSKVLPRTIAPKFVPRTFDTGHCSPGKDKIVSALDFIRTELRAPETVIAKPRNGDNGVGIAILGRCPIAPSTHDEPQSKLRQMLERYGDVVVQEYLPSVRAPSNVGELADVPIERHDFGEIRFILIDGTVPRCRDGHRIVVARRVPTADSLVADSGISYPTQLSGPEQAFLTEVGRAYLKLGIHFGGGDLIRTPDPQRPFLFTDAARSVCGHAVVTGALNGEPYLIVDQVLDSIERRLVARRARRRPKSRALAVA